MMIQDEKTIRFLTRSDLKAAFYLHPFFKEAKTLKEVCEESGSTMGKYYYWIKKFLEHGLLRVAFEKKRNGSTIKYYITTAKELVIVVDGNLPLLRSYYQTASNKYSNRIVSGASQTLFDQELALGIGITQGGQKNLETRIVYLPNGSTKLTSVYDRNIIDSPASFAAWKNLQLNFGDAKEFRQKLIELIEEYEKKSNPAYGDYFIQVAIVPKV